jgi:hypothetical protein
MGKAIAWILSLTKLGKVVTPVQKFLSGKKTNLAGLALAVPALIAILHQFSEQGMAYLVTVHTTPEFKSLMEGIAMIALRSAITKAADSSKDPNVKAES